MASDNNIKTVSIIDAQTNKQIYTSALINFRLAGWENFQDSLYTDTNKRLLSQDVESKVEFNQPVLFPKFERQPRIGSTPFPIWDFNTQKIVSYKENDLCNATVRLQFVAEAVNSATGVGMEANLTVPSYLTIFKETKSLLKGTNPQRLSFILPFYYDENTIENGVELYLKPLGDDIRIYETSIFIQNW